MIRTTLQAALCLCLSPLLMAQQVSHETAQLPAGRQVDASAASAYPNATYPRELPLPPAAQSPSASTSGTNQVPAATNRRQISGKLRNHHGITAKNCLKWAVRSVELAILLPLLLPYILLVSIILLPACKDGC